MTIIVAKKEDTKIVLCADGQCTYGTNKVNTCKLLNFNRGYIGLAGEARYISLLSLFLRKNTLPDQEVFEDTLLDFFHTFYEWCLKINNALTPMDTTHFLCVIDNKLFTNECWDVCEHSLWCAIGSGQFLAAGALAMNATAKKAVEIACQYDLYCGGDIHEINIPYHTTR